MRFLIGDGDDRSHPLSGRLNGAAEALHRERGMTVLTVQACCVAEELHGGSCNGPTHAGEIEALAVRAYRPDLVNLDRINYSSEIGELRQVG